MKTGKILKEDKAFPSDSELKTAEFLASRGHNILFIAPSRHRNTKTPDIEMNKKRWEIKRPKGKGKYNLQHAFKAALKQSPNIIIDLRSLGMNESNNIRKLTKLFNDSANAKSMLIITKSLKLLEYKK